MIFASEQELVATYFTLIDKSIWTIYPETANFDFVLLRKDGFQIGFEAKLKLNTKVISQAADLLTGGQAARARGPDCRAVLVPHGKERNEYASLLRALQVVVVRVGGRAAYPYASRNLPIDSSADWPEHFPCERLALPDYVPDVVAGVRGPTKLTLWKVKAIKLVILLQRRGYLVRADFLRFDVSPSTWTQRGWLVTSAIRGQWIAGEGIPDFESQHPVNFAQIAADFAKWNAKDIEGY